LYLSGSLEATQLGADDRVMLLQADYRVFHNCALHYYYGESEGDHTWKYWDEHIQEALDYLLHEE